MARSTYEDFIIKEKVGSGSYGVVFKVVRKVDKQVYAMKEIDLQGMSRKVRCVRLPCSRGTLKVVAGGWLAMPAAVYRAARNGGATAARGVRVRVCDGRGVCAIARCAGARGVHPGDARALLAGL